jgi:hypothetical protein
MITYIILAVITAIALTYKSEETDAILYFAGMCGIMLLIGYNTPAEGFRFHYTFCGYFNLLILIPLIEMKKSFLIISLKIITVGFILASYLGYATNVRGIDVLLYNNVCIGLYTALLLTMIAKWCTDGLGDYRVCWRDVFLYRDSNKRISKMDTRSEGA